MINLAIYYLTILLPFSLLLWLSKSEQPVLFTILLLIYALPYRAAVDGARLVNKRILKPKEIWTLLIPGRRRIYFKELYLKK